MFYSEVTDVLISKFTNNDNQYETYEDLDIDIDQALESVNSDTYEGGLITEDMEEVDVDIKNGIAIMDIPTLGVNALITEGTSKEQLRYSIGHFESTPMFGEHGNICVAGHSSAIYKCVFNGLDTVPLYTEIDITTSSYKYTYYIVDRKVIEPYDTYILNESTEDKLTLVTCTEGGTKRLCITAKPLSDEQLANLKSKDTTEEDLVFDYGTSSRVINSIFPYFREIRTLKPLGIKEGVLYKPVSYETLPSELSIYLVPHTKYKVYANYFNSCFITYIGKQELRADVIPSEFIFKALQNKLTILHTDTDITLADLEATENVEEVDYINLIYNKNKGGEVIYEK